MTIEQSLQALNLSLPPIPTPQANYVPAVRTGNLIYVSGQLPSQDGSVAWLGCVPSSVSPEEAYQAARVAALNAVAAVGSAVSDLNQIRRVVRLTGYVQSDPGFNGQSAVINGASDLLIDLFGEAGKHARVAIGVAALPRNAPVEIDLIVEIAE